MNLSLLAFCARSLWREYGTAFLTRVVLAHPVATARGVARYAREPNAEPGRWQGGEKGLVGIGFCVKPLSPACPAGRANHRCQYFENGRNGNIEPCRHCLIRAVGQHALASGSALCIMTSAHDILHDVLLPALRSGRFRSAVLVMCRYSFEPVRLALAICGIDATLFPFREGDCRDYSTWRRADLGDKPEQTLLNEATLDELVRTLSSSSCAARARSFRRVGNLYEPRYS